MNQLKKPDLTRPAFLLYPKLRNRIEEGLCPMCSKTIKEQEFRDIINKEEYSISGMCQECQDNTFK